MAKIRVLPDQVANQIAAGEVIERPASVVKELVENSIDAGATRIEVEFRKGGTSFMRIEDNGCGMGRDDALLSLERHATSKIRKAKDLDSLGTMGFRGEALPSIASVSRFQLQTRERGAEAGTDVLVDGGRIVHARDCGMPEGTRITVSKLFNTVPARRKFLKSLTTEAAHIVHSVRLYALAHPEVAFTLIDDGRILFQTATSDRLQDRISDIFGGQIGNGLIEIDASEEGLRLFGFVGKPSLSRSSRHEMLFFVNHRPVENKTLSYALVESYYGHIPKGRYPVAFLFLDILPEQVDVNVHPAKREIRFREEAKARGFAVRAILQALRSEKDAIARVSPVSVPRSAGPRLPANPPESTRPQTAKRLVTPSSEKRQGAEAAQKAIPAQTAAAKSEAATIPLENEKPAPPPKEAPEAARQSVNQGWEYLGWAQGEFAVFDTGVGVVLLNYKAAQQRICYERLMRDFQQSEVKTQRLLLPHPIEFDPVSSAVAEENLSFFALFGLEVSPFGRNFFRIEGSPVWLDEGLVESFFKDLVAELRQGSLNPGKEDAAAEKIAKMAAMRIFRAGREPRPNEIDTLLQQLFECATPLTDPNGRPSLIEISSGELNKRFQRRSSKEQPDLF